MRPALTALLALLLAAGGIWWLVTERLPATLSDAAALDSSEPELEDPVPSAELTSVGGAAPQEATRLALPPGKPLEPMIKSSSTTGEPTTPPEDLGVRVRARVLSLGQPVALEALELELREVNSPAQTVHSSHSNRSDEEGRVTFVLGPPEDYGAVYAVLLRSVDNGRHGWSAEDHLIESGVIDVGDIELLDQRALYPTPLVSGWVLDEFSSPVPGVAGTASPVTLFGEGVEGEEGTASRDPREDWSVRPPSKPVEPLRSMVARKWRF